MRKFMSPPLLGVFTFVGLLTLASCSPATQRAMAPLTPGDLRIDGVTIVDTLDGSLSPDMSLTIEDGLITHIAPHGEVGEPAPGVRRIDASGQFVVPGYNNMHSHALGGGDPARELAFMLSEGITGFRQMSGSTALLAARRAGTLSLGAHAPALLVMPGEVLTPFNAGSPAAAREEIRRQAEAGANFIKVGIVSPDVFFAALDEARAQDLPIVGHIQQGVDPRRAADEGFHAIEHLGPGDAFWIACSSDEEALRRESAASPPLRAPPFPLPGFVQQFIMTRIAKRLINPAAFESPETVARLQSAFDSYDADRCRGLAAHLAETETWQTPTLVRLRTQELADDPAYESDPTLAYMTPESIRDWREVTARFHALPDSTHATFRAGYQRNLELTRLLYEAGVPMMLGTDGGGFTVPGQSLHQEIDELSAAGLPPLAILQMTTINAARFLGRTDTMGAVALNHAADLVLLNADPTVSASALHEIAGVVRAGMYYGALELEQLRDSLKTSAEETR